MITRLRYALHSRLTANPLAAVLLVLFAIALYGSWQRGRELTLACKMVRLPAFPPSKPTNDVERAFKICSDRLSD